MKTPLSVTIDREMPDPHEIQRISAVVVSVGYSDFLVETLRQNINQVDEIHVVTHPDDKKTQDVCRYYSVHCLPTEVLYDRNRYFNKSGAINYGLMHLPQKGWWLHLDADILLPNGFKRMLEVARLEQSCLYGVDRLNVIGWQAYTKLLKAEEWTNQWEQRCAVVPYPHAPLGGRQVDETGYSPIGYFQLWYHGQQRKYTSNCGHAGNDDVIFAQQWSAVNRRVLPTTYVYHLMSEEVTGRVNGTGSVLNWWGRKSQPFVDPATLPPAPPAVDLGTVTEAAHSATRVYFATIGIHTLPWEELSDEVKLGQLNRAKWVTEHPTALPYDEASDLKMRRAQTLFAHTVLGFKGRIQ